MSLSPFHLAFPVHDLEAARRFYGDLLGCAEGRSAADWVDFNLYGHQIVAHLVKGVCDSGSSTNIVDREAVPVPHFGVVLPMGDWKKLSDRLRQRGVAFVIEPHIRFAGEAGEQATMFFRDPSGNALEFKAMADVGNLFSKHSD